MNHLRREFDLGHEDVRDRIERAGRQFAHGGMSTREWAKVRQAFAVLVGAPVPAAAVVVTYRPAETAQDGW